MVRSGTPTSSTSPYTGHSHPVGILPGAAAEGGAGWRLRRRGGRGERARGRRAMPARPASGFATASSAKGCGRKRFACPGLDRIVASHGPAPSSSPHLRATHFESGDRGARTLGCQAHRPVPRRGRCATGGRNRVRIRCPAVVHPSFGHRPGCGRDRCRLSSMPYRHARRR